LCRSRVCLRARECDLSDFAAPGIDRARSRRAIPADADEAHRSHQSRLRRFDGAAASRRKKIGVTLEDLTAATQMLVRVPSVNPSIAPREGHGESQVAAVARDWLLEHGVRAWLEDAAPGRSNLVAEVGAGAGPLLVFCAHLDPGR